jgi:hypothetical protein
MGLKKIITAVFVLLLLAVWGASARPVKAAIYYGCGACECCTGNNCTPSPQLCWETKETEP